MKIFQIWIEGPDQPSPELLGYMQTVINQRPVGSEYLLYSTHNYFQDTPVVQWFSVDTAIAELLSHKSRLAKIVPILSLEGKADLLRYHLASHLGDCMYLDCDVEVLEWPVLPVHGVWFCPLTKNDPKMIDGHIFGVRGDSPTMVDLFSQLVTTTVFAHDCARRITLGFTYHFLNRFFNQHRLTKIDATCFEHHNRG